ncbi:WD40/YVTN/BNR-like repeat-containing protein [Pseudochryseolinea flava]|uniref:Oxidoreductase n=1 Tax=Pseudochryseolinea flava TaxID=2059302 RepID=A0A364Y1V9_9BACT|nr:YCF48-related protein [Pseudochryseolinea flava]RAW00620.1 oxidoreductase [Pseudochryseolinea flava]
MKLFTLAFLLSTCTLFAQQNAYHWIDISTDTKASFRGLSVVNDKVAWLGGSKGTIGSTVDGGKTWNFKVLEGYEALDFRSVYAFDEKNVIVANAGTPAYILRTSDGGQSWRRVYENTDKDAFIDGIDFWDSKSGVVYGDPIASKMLLLKTSDGGESWTMVADEKRPVMKEGEASFAASGTGVRCLKNNQIIILTGGQTSRLWASKDGGENWTPTDLPIIQGGKMTGGYSVAFFDLKKGIIVGGNWDDHLLTTDHIVMTNDGGKTWTKPTTPTRGLRECVEYLDAKTVVAVGQKGADISYDGGATWTMLSDLTGFDVARKARKGNLIVVAGGQGKVALLQKSSVKK